MTLRGRLLALAVCAAGVVAADRAATAQPAASAATPVAAASSASSATSPEVRNETSVEPLPVDQVAPGIYVHSGLQQDWLPSNGGDIANIGFIVGERCVAVVDTGGNVDIGQRLRVSIQRVTPLPVCWVINTHMHPDHVLGNVAFTAASAGASAPVFVASAKLPRALSAREPYMLHSLERDFHEALGHESIIYPSVTVTDTRELDLGGRSLKLQAWPTAHTDNDLTVYDSRTKTLFLGDLLFVGHLPVVDGSLRGWLAVMKDLRSLDVATAIPGHGQVSREWPAALEKQQSYLTALLLETRAAIKRKMTIQQAVDTVAVEAAKPWLLVDVFHRRNVTAAYAELEWEE